MLLPKRVFYHLRTILIHKYWVYHYGRMLGLGRWQLICHDLSKFHPTEFFESVKFYDGTRSPIGIAKEEQGVSWAWMHHFKKNKHHFQYWMYLGSTTITYVEMPKKYLLEAIADIVGASRAYNRKNFTLSAPLNFYRGDNDFVHVRENNVIIKHLEYFARTGKFPPFE